MRPLFLSAADHCWQVHQKQLKEQQAAEQGTYPGNDDSARGGHVAEKL